MRGRSIMHWVIIGIFLFPASIASAQHQRNNIMTKKSSGYAPVNGLKMYYEIYGEGATPLILIHGGGSTIESNYGRFLPHIAGYGKIIAIELQAHGRTSDRDAPESFEQDADDVAGLMRYLKVDKANVLGFSDGGCTTMQLAIRHPEMVGKLVVVAANYTRAGMVAGFFDMLDRVTLDSMPAPLKEAYLQVSPYKEKGLITMFTKDRARRLAFKDFPEEDMRSIQASTLLIVGDRDVIRTEHVVQMSHLIPHARLVVLPGVHGSCLAEICSIEQGSKLPEVTAQLVLEHLERND